MLTDGAVFEQAGVNFSSVSGQQLPPAATAHRPELAGSAWTAQGASLVIHPRNPYIPTTHLNVRFFEAKKPDGESAWWFGGGFDLTPYYPFDEDSCTGIASRAICARRSAKEVYPKDKKWCDDYFFIKHRGETRGVGGLFFDDLHAWEFERSFAFQRAVGDGFLDRGSSDRRKTQRHTPFGELANASSSFIAADAMSNSISSTTAARCSGCSLAVAPNQY